MSNSEIIRKHKQEVDAKGNISVILEKKVKRNSDDVIYHNFRTGGNFDKLEDAVDGESEYLLVKKTASNCFCYEHLTNDEDILVLTTKASDYPVYKLKEVEHEGEKFLCMLICHFNLRSTLTSENEIRDWEVDAKLYIDKNKVVYPSRYFDYHNFVDFQDIDYKSIEPVYNWWTMEDLDNLGFGGYRENDALRKLLDKYNNWGVVTLGANNKIVVDNAYKLCEFLKYKEPKKKTGPKQRKIDELTSYELEKPKAPKFQLDSNLIGYERRSALMKTRFVNISAVLGVDKTICCYRTFFALANGTFREGARIYIEEGGKFTACKMNNFGEWVNTSINYNNSDFSYKINYVNFDACKGTLLEYLIPMFESVENQEAGRLIASSLLHPCIEKLYKSEFKEAVDIVSKNSYYKTWESLIEKLGELNEKGKNAFAIVGVNKNQLKKAMEAADRDDIKQNRLYHDGFDIIKTIKEMTNKQSIVDVDAESFDLYLNVLTELLDYRKKIKTEGHTDSEGYVHYLEDGRFNWGTKEYYSSIRTNELICINVISKLSKLYPAVTVRSMIPKVIKAAETYIETPEERFSHATKEMISFISLSSYINTYKSYIDMVEWLVDVEELRDRPVPSPHFQDLSYIKVLHDDIVEVYNYYKNIERRRYYDEQNARRNEEHLERAKKAAEKWAQIKSQWDKWIYEDETYSVVAPQDPYDLVLEGTELGHCVGGYIDKVIKRTTNILFIRRKESLDKSLFTVEILSNGTVEQIHGRRNSCLSDDEVISSEPTINSFVDKWAYERSLSLHGINKVR